MNPGDMKVQAAEEWFVNLSFGLYFV
jgi:hypothetical protein